MIKKLDWKNQPRGQKSCCGVEGVYYTIIPQENEYMTIVSSDGGLVVKHPTLEEAKAFCQKDFELAVSQYLE